MAKKKTSALYQLLHMPISLPLVGMLGLIGTSLVSLNLSIFLNQPQKTSTFPSTISQYTLQNVLGTTISIGEQPKKNPDSVKNDPVITYWQTVLTSKPNYPDAYIALAVASFNNRDCSNTRFYLDKAHNLDPDNKKFQDLMPHLKTCLEVEK